jgi:hypothetical protein
MKRIRRSFYISLVVAAAVEIIAFSLYGYPALALIPLLVATLWGLAEFRQWHWAATPAFIIFVVLLIPATVLRAHWFYLLIGLLATLTAWDLSRWMALAGRAQRLEDEALLVGMHARRLGGVLLAGLLLSLLGINLQFRIIFGGAFLLALSLILALSRLVSFFRRA